MAPLGFAYTAVTFCGHLFHGVLLPIGVQSRRSCNPLPKARFGLFPVRSSLTKGISFDFYSSEYLDISVPRVSPQGL